MFKRKYKKTFDTFLLENIQESSKEALIKKLKEEYFVFRKKFLISYGIFVTLNLLVFSVSAILVVLNLFAIRLNVSDVSRPFFIAIAFITGSITFFTSLSSFFTFKNNQKNLKNKLQRVEEHFAKFQEDHKNGKEMEVSGSALLDHIINTIKD